ncbi:MAG TPA: beta-aspartyl-peptidase [Halanaerobiales bacterium]|nr:beta-aspartyl-peptidase [Halanaerobiales bacterium]
MNIIIKNAEIFDPNFIGKKDIWVVGDKIISIEDNISENFNLNFLNFKTINAEGKYLVPGFIDTHVHFLGGGGEGGFKTRTPEIKLTDITKGGVTTAIGCLGTDSVTRNLRSLLAKSKALEEEGITTYMYTGSYRIPVNTITEGIREDIILIDKIIGTGEVAIEDHRSSQPTYNEFKKVVAETSIGGMLAGKAGIVNIHMGGGKNGLGYLYKIIEEDILSPKNMLPTHINRSQTLLEQGRDYAKIGGLIDLTTSSSSNQQKTNECAASLKFLLEEGTPIENITFSSDAQGSLPKFDENGKMTGMRIGQVSSLFAAVRSAVKDLDINLETALKVITENPARIFNLENKGKIKKDNDADLVILDKESLEIESVIAKGEILFEDKQAVVKGTFQ